MARDVFYPKSSGTPWYYDDYKGAHKSSPKAGEYLSYTPQKVKAMLEKNVVDQEEACRKVAVMIYQHLHGHRFVGMLAGPTGSGKSFIGENLKKSFPDLVYLRDVSNVTCDGWKGGKKVGTLFKDVDISYSYNPKIYPILFLDECDKLFSPKTNSSEENVSESVQYEFLSAIHGGEVIVEENEKKGSSRVVDTSHMSFLFAGAFEKSAKTIAEKESGPSIGFSASHKRLETYNRELTMDDVHEAGCISELCGRIQKLVCLTKLKEEAYRNMLDIHDRGPLYEMEKEFNLSITISTDKKDELAYTASQSGLGMRGLKNLIREYIDELIWEDCNAKILNIC